ncbi:hypothetical protein SEA_BUCK_104 [Mycobacterium phage Buck]|nr:hypothetical protein SEA_BUCK_104 [Mycobacterium phage Buck]
MSEPIPGDIRVLAWLGADTALSAAQETRMAEGHDPTVVYELLIMAQAMGTLAAASDTVYLGVIQEMERRERAEAEKQEMVQKLISEKLNRPKEKTQDEPGDPADDASSAPDEADGVGA